MQSITAQALYVKNNEINIFYRQAEPPGIPKGTVLLLHGFPSSSHQFRNLIPLLAAHGYRVIAPDLPGFGFTTVPNDYVYNFENLAKALEDFVSALRLEKFAMYIFDYGAPAGLRMALKNPQKVAAIISQNGNAYEEGFGAEFWAPIKKYWQTGSTDDRDALRPALELDAVKQQYTDGSPHPDKIHPESYYLDHALMERKGNKETQLNLLYDYGSNIDQYPLFQTYFRTSKVPVLAIWGKNDKIFIPPGAEAFRGDVEKFELRWLDAGHFAIETNEREVAEAMDSFFKKFDVFRE